MEYRKKCNVCGKIFCYDDSDVSMNKLNAVITGLSGLGGASAAINGNAFQRIEANQHMQMNDPSKIKDFNKCPYCGSTNLKLLTEEEIEKEKKIEQAKNINLIGVDPDALIKRAKIFLEDGEFEIAEVYAENGLNGSPENPYGYLYKLMAELKIKTMEEFDSCCIDFSNFYNYVKAIKYFDEDHKVMLQGYSKKALDNIYINEKEKEYNIAINNFEKAKEIDDYFHVISLFENLDDYRDSKLKIEECKNRIDLTKKEKIYLKAYNLSKSNKTKDIKEAIKLFDELYDYKDSQKIKDGLIKNLEHFKDNENKRKKKSIVGILLSLLIIVITFYYFKYYMPSKKYERALELINNGELIKGATYLYTLNDYKDSKQLINDLAKKEPLIAINQANIGDVITMGDIEIDGNHKNGTEPIIWIVLDKKINDVLLISASAIEYYRTISDNMEQTDWLNNNKYSDSEGFSWYKSPARKYLNDSFIKCIPNDYMEFIVPNESIDKEEGKYNDNVFILNEEEIRKYFSSEKERIADPSVEVMKRYLDLLGDYWSKYTATPKSYFDYSYEKGINEYGGYWLRNDDDNNNDKKRVNKKGEIESGKTNEIPYGLRPALWIRTVDSD